MKTTYHIPFQDPTVPKRGDLLQSNVGHKLERTWLIISSCELPMRVCPEMGGIMTRRYKIWAERWWVLEPSTRQRLHRCAERAGGQQLLTMKRFPAKKKRRTFEQLMGAR